MKNIIVILFCILGLNFENSAQTEAEMVIETTSEAIVKAHVEFLASDALKGRDVNTDGGMAAAEYIKANFMRYGVEKAPGMDSYFQSVRLKKVLKQGKGELSFKNNKLVYGEDFIFFQGRNMELESNYVFAMYGMEHDLSQLKVKGKIIVALCGDGVKSSPRDWFNLKEEKVRLAKAKGAIGLIEIYQSIQMPWRLIKPYFKSTQLTLDKPDESDSFVHIWMNTTNPKHIEVLKKGKGKKKHKMNIRVSGQIVDAFETPNVVGVIEGTDPKLKNEYVIYSAHYDHIGVGIADAEGDTIYNGARDNAIGTAGVLAAVEQFAKYPTKRSALFIAFTAEEKGLLGSKWFAKYSPVPLHKIAYCFNIDNAGYNDTSLVTVFGLGRTTTGHHMINACKTFGLKAIDDPAPEQNLFDRSDNVSFAERGIPAPTFSMGFTAFDDAINKYYHQASDEADSIDFPYLLKYIRSFLLSGRLIANDPVKPFWTKGDKYYDVGVKLYGTPLKN